MNPDSRQTDMATRSNLLLDAESADTLISWPPYPPAGRNKWVWGAFARVAWKDQDEQINLEVTPGISRGWVYTDSPCPHGKAPADSTRPTQAPPLRRGLRMLWTTSPSWSISRQVQPVACFYAHHRPPLDHELLGLIQMVPASGTILVHGNHSVSI